MYQTPLWQPRDVTSDMYGNYGISWTPKAQGLYQIVARFDGTDSYGSSSASTYVTVGPVSATPEPETPTPTPSTTPPPNNCHSDAVAFANHRDSTRWNTY